MTPYYEDGAVTIYHADCRVLLPSLVVDAVVTDPPYGIGADRRQGQRATKKHGNAAGPSRDYGPISDWDARPPDAPLLAALLALGRHHVIWGGNHFALPPAAGWLVWDKDNGKNGYADCELAWTDLPIAIRRTRFRWMGMLQELPEPRYHPTQKPLPVMRWCVELLPKDADLILDPFMGSGTTLRAAKDCGRRAIGIEAEERYCEVAASRMTQEVLALGT